MKVKLNS
jgi:hypothetical protein